MTAGFSAVFVDTNILIYASSSCSPNYPKAKAYVEELVNSKTEVYISRQVIREFLAVMSRDSYFSVPTTRPKMLEMTMQLSKLFLVADEDESVTERLLALLREHNISGKRVHDANIVATMLANSVHRLVTANERDFTRFRDIIEVISIDHAGG